MSKLVLEELNSYTASCQKLRDGIPRLDVFPSEERKTKYQKGTSNIFKPSKAAPFLRLGEASILRL